MNVITQQCVGRADRYFLLAWLVIGIVAVLGMAFVTPPFQTPDEAQHYFRAYQISEGTMLADVEHGQSGGHLPVSLQGFAEHFLGSVLLHGDRPVQPTPLARTLATPFPPLAPEQRAFINFSGLSFYAPMAYASEALAINLARQAGVGSLATFYLARIANGMFALAILFCALRLLPFGRELIAFVALLPMAMSLYGSCSPDATIIATGFLFTALVFNRIGTGKWNARDTVIAIVCATTFCAIKPVYAPLLLLGFAGVVRARDRAGFIKHQCVVLLVSLAATVIWLRLAAPAMVPVKLGPNPPAQLVYILDVPLRYVLAMAHSLRWNDFYYQQFVGRLGWLSIPLPMLAYLLPPVALLAAWGSQQRVPEQRAALFITYGSMLLCASVVLLLTALYLTWTPVGKFDVEGVQGRYFLPLAPLPALLLLMTSARKKYWEKSMTQVIILTLIVVEAGIALSTLASRYAVF
jgi:uncharacterized membrane protein